MLRLLQKTDNVSFQGFSEGFKSASTPLQANISAVILDEVALEGLDGITISMLKYRLKYRNDNFRPDLSSAFILNVLQDLIERGKIQAFKLPKARNFEQPLERVCSDTDKSVVIDPQKDIIDPYPFKVVSDDNGLMGSCADYNERKTISGKQKLENLDEKIIVFVATQEERGKALLGSLYDPLIFKSLMPLTFSMLERIGRSRHHGDCTVGKISLKLLKITAKDLFYHRKQLLKHGLITKQLYTVRSKEQNMKGLLFHLPRFYVENRPKWQENLYNLVKYLKQQPQGIASYEDVKTFIGEVEYLNIKRFFKMPQVTRFIKLNLSYALNKLKPDWDEKQCKGKNGSFRNVRVMQLINPDMSPEDVLYDTGKDGDLDGEQDDEDDEESCPLTDQVSNRIDRSIIFQAYEAIDNAGPEGLSSNEFRQKLNLNKLDARNQLKYMEKREWVDTYMKDYRRQKATMYVAKRYKNALAKSQNCPKFTHSRNSPKVAGSPSLKRQTVLTQKNVLRQKIIMDLVKDQIVIDEPVKIYRHVVDEERKSGSDDVGGVMDRKTFRRLIQRMADEKKLINIRIKIDTGEKSKELNFVCMPHITENDDIVKACVEQHKMKMKFTPASVENEENAGSVSESIKEMFQMIGTQSPPGKIAFDTKMGRVNGVKPKFVRARELHKFLFFLTRDYDGEAGKRGQMLQLARRQGLQVTAEIEKELEHIEVYQKDVNWKTFVPQLPQHKDWPQGWILICDALLRLPLSLFRQLVCLNYKLQGLDEYFSHPIKKHYLIKNLPNEAKRQLLYTRKYIFSIYEDIQKLAYMGLVQFGINKTKEKDQVFVYINQRTKLADTRSSVKGYHHIEKKSYPEIKYNFEQLEDLDKYWHDLYEISIATNLGHAGGMGGKEVLIEDLHKKPAMMATLEGRRVNEVEENDTYDIPGDQRGASGLDSSLFAHVKRNWLWVQSEGSLRKPDTPVKAKPLKTNETKGKNVPHKKGSKRKYPEPEFDQEAGVPFPIKPKPPSKVRKIKEREKKESKKPAYDEIDLEALKLMVGQRVEWSKNEDTLLLLSKVAGTFLCQNSLAQGQMVPYILVRDELHMRTPELSKNKTSRACQRRINYMIKNANTMKNISVFLSEIRTNSEVLKNFPIPKRGEMSKEENEKRLQDQFPKLMDLLIKLFKNKTLLDENKPEFKIPKDIADLRAEFEVAFPDENIGNNYNHVEPSDQADIKASVIWNTILSSLCCREDKTNWAFHLFKIYQQYEDNLLRKVLIHLRRSKMISLNKKAKRLGAKEDNIPLNASPYQLSVTFLHKFLSRYQPEIYNSIQKVYANLSEKNDLLEIAFGSEGGGAATVAILSSLDAIQMKIQVPEQIIVLDPNISERNEKFALMVEKYKDMVVKTHQPKMNEVLTNKVEKKTGQKRKRTAESTEETDIAFTEESSEKGQLMAARSGSRLALYLKQDSLNSGSSEINLQHTYDYFVVASCQISVKLVEDIQFEEKPSYIAKIDLNDVEAAESNQLFDLIDSKEKLGALVEDIKKEDLGNLKSLLDSKKVIRVGIVKTRFVSFRHCHPWLLHSFDVKRRHRENVEKIDWNQVEMLDLKVRPWIKINGLVNKRILDYMLISLLNYIIGHPGAKMGKIADHFQPALQPFHTRELIEMLQSLKCLRLVILGNKKPSLFSKPCEGQAKEADILDEADEIYVEPLTDAMVKLAQFANHNTKIFECPCHYE